VLCGASVEENSITVYGRPSNCNYAGCDRLKEMEVVVRQI